jgi:DNA-binding response OmpR family regulator
MFADPYLPSPPKAAGASAARPRPGSNGQDPAGTVFVADDNPSILQGLDRALTTYGYRVRTADNGLRLLDLLEESGETPDLLLLDVSMPGMSGVEVIEHVREHPRWRQLPVMFITADRDAGLPASVFDMGAVDFLHKPFRLSELLARIQSHVARSRELRQARAEARAGLRALDLLEDTAEARTPQDLFRRVTRGVAQQLKLRRCSVILVEEVRGFGRVQASSDSMDAEGLVLTLANYPEIGAALERGEAVWVEDVETSPLFAELVADWERTGFGSPLHSVVVVPFTLPEGGDAVLVARASGEEPPVSGEDAHLVQRVAEGVGRCLRRLAR